MWKNKRYFVLVVVLLAAATTCFAQEAKLIAVLKSGSTQEQKAAACRQLARIATKESVPALAALLADEKLSHMARYSLETIPDPSVDEALRGALGKLKGRPLLGVIGSLGVRRDGQAVDKIAAFLSADDSTLVQAAARALGKIGTPAASKVLERAVTDAAGANQLAVCEGLFRCAEAFHAQGQNAASQAIYDRLRKLASPPPQVRAAALRGAILARGNAGIPLLLDAVRAPDFALTSAAARTAMELPGKEVTEALSSELPNLPADKQIVLIRTLGYRGDTAAGPALLAAASEGPAAVRKVAIENLTHLGYTPALPLLANLSLSNESNLTAVARTCLQFFPGKGADVTILTMFANSDAKVRGLAIEMIAQRNIPGSNATLLHACDDADESVRHAAFRALSQRAAAADLPALLNILVKSRSSADATAAEAALVALCVRESKPASRNVAVIKALYGDLSAGLAADVTAKVAALIKSGNLGIEASNSNFGDPAEGRVKKLRVDYSVNHVSRSSTVAENETLTISAISTPPAITESICRAIPIAQGVAKLALLRSLRTAGGPTALEAIRAASVSSDPQIKETAFRILCDWNSPDAIPSLIDIITTPPSKTLKILAMRGLARLAPLEEASETKKVETLKTAMSLADRDEERQLILSALGSFSTKDSLALAASQLDNPVLREEACVAAVSIAEKLGDKSDSHVTQLMKKVAKATQNKDLAARAEAIASHGPK